MPYFKLKAEGRFDQDKKELFLKIFAETGNIVESAKSVGVSRTAVYYHRTPNNPFYDPEFAQDFEMARKLGAEALEGRLNKILMHGTAKYVTSGGKLIMDPLNPANPLLQHEFYPNMMVRALESHDPERWGPRQKHDLNGSVNITISADDEKL